MSVEIAYESNILTCNTECPHGMRFGGYVARVGSMSCVEKCAHNSGHSDIKKNIICNHPDNSIEKDNALEFTSDGFLICNEECSLNNIDGMPNLCVAYNKETSLLWSELETAFNAVCTRKSLIDNYISSIKQGDYKIKIRS